MRVGDLPAEGADLRRLGGPLLFFTAIELEEGDASYGLWAGDCSKVIHARPGTTLSRATAPKRGVLKLDATRLRFSGRPDVPALGDDDRALPPHDFKIADWERWYILRDALRGGLGMPDQLLGYSDTPNGGNGCSAAPNARRTPGATSSRSMKRGRSPTVAASKC